ncbi:ORF6N domain-containing protein [Pedobacter sp. MC2016-05]|nr:ORF6N domain-containing protein [Pedobacter sp. MC2016-05]MCX2473854.1 ORF6N domain-containing protein [Pedobacter sp. MC2016-05]
MQIIKSIQSRIYTIRGERVMLDFDLALLYEVETKVLNQQTTLPGRFYVPINNRRMGKFEVSN